MGYVATIMKIRKYANIARKDLDIESYPGNLFAHLLTDNNYLYKYNMMLFKMDMGDDISGFIKYTSRNNYAVIGVNTRRSFGHQNYSMAHEIGHLYLHRDTHEPEVDVLTDKYEFDDDFSEKKQREREADLFASEFLYPEHCLENDLKDIDLRRLFMSQNRVELYEFINILSHKYYISFQFCLQRILGKYYDGSQTVRRISSHIMHDMGSLIKRYPSPLYYNDGLSEFYADFYPKDIFEELVKDSIEQREISQDVGEDLRYHASEMEVI